MDRKRIIEGLEKAVIVGITSVGAGVVGLIQANRACNKMGVDVCDMFSKAGVGAYDMIGEMGYYATLGVVGSLVLGSLYSLQNTADEKSKNRIDKNLKV